MAIDQPDAKVLVPSAQIGRDWNRHRVLDRRDQALRFEPHSGDIETAFADKFSREITL